MSTNTETLARRSALLLAHGMVDDGAEPSHCYGAESSRAAALHAAQGPSPGSTPFYSDLATLMLVAAAMERI
jgi:hypothetical protein